MISLAGRGLILLALLFAVFGSLAGYLAGSRRSPAAWKMARNSALGFSGAMIAANLLMIYALVTHDFSVHYVSTVGSLDTPLHITIISLWSSLEGSILFWGGILGCYTGAFVLYMGDKHREYMPWTLHVLMAICVFFAVLVASVADPFHVVSPVPLNGPGPNPLLQNHWLMAAHPPTLYLGYVGMAIPYSMICAGLLNGRLEAGWLAPLRRWMLIPWAFLTIGIVLGGWWSYEVLGWGGYWAWDPVENASFHPWLTGTAFLHSVMVLQRRGKMRDWTLLLGMATFLLTLVGTFMTRSGVFNSVHSFTQSPIGPIFLWFIGITLVYSIVLLAFRSHKLDEAADSQNTRLGTESRGGMSLLGREFAILIQNALFTVFTFTVLLGTLYPLIVEAVQDRKISVGEPYFDRWALPLGLGIVFMMGVGPVLPWGKLKQGTAAVRLGLPLVSGLAMAGVGAIFGIDKPFTLLSLLVCGFALHANVAEFVEPVRARMHKGESILQAIGQVLSRAHRRFGAHVAHIGVIMAVIAIALSKGYRVEDSVTLRQGESATVGAYTATYRGARLDNQDHRRSVVASFDVTREGRSVGVLEPRMNYYPTRREPIGSPMVLSTFREDFFLSITEIPGDGAYIVVRILTMPAVIWLWIAPFVIAFGTVMSLWPNRGRREASP